MGWEHIPHNWPRLGDADEQNVLACLRSGRFWRGDGRLVVELERQFAEMHGARFGLALTNGTHALEVALAAAGISYGDEVLVPAFTFMSSATAVLFRNALPIPVDVNADDYCIDVAQIEPLITARTKAIMPVHMSGQACEMDKIRDLAARYGLAVVEDCAHAIDVGYHSERESADLRLGACGSAGCFSFQSSKVLVGGEGGMLLTDNADLYRRALSFSNYGWIPDGMPYDHFMVASNYRMPELTAALLMGQLPRLASFKAERHRNISLAEQILDQFGTVSFQRSNPTTINHGHFYFIIVMAELAGAARDQLVDGLVSRGIPARRVYPSFHRTRMFQTLAAQCPHMARLEHFPHYASMNTPVSDFVAEHGLWIPHWFFLDGKSAEKIEAALRELGVS